MKRFFAVTFPDAGLTYELDMRDIASAMVRALATEHPDRRMEDLAAVVMADFADDAKALKFLSLLTWPDICESARLVAYQPPAPLQLATAVWSAGYDERRTAQLPSPSDPDSGREPFDLHVSVMWQIDPGARLRAALLTDAAGVVNGAMIFVSGKPEEISAYLAVCGQLTDQIAEHPEGRAPRPAYNH